MDGVNNCPDKQTNLSWRHSEAWAFTIQVVGRHSITVPDCGEEYPPDAEKKGREVIVVEGWETNKTDIDIKRFSTTADSTRMKRPWERI
jgi:hypothetical protein